MKKFWNHLKFAWQYTKNLKKQFILYLFCNLLTIVVSLILPIFSARIIIYLTDSMFYQLLGMVIVYTILQILFNFINYFCSYFSQIIYRESFIHIQTELGKEIMKLETSVIDKNGSGVFIQRLTNDTSRLADIFNVLSMYLSRILTNIGIFFAVLIINVWAFLYLVVMVGILFIIERRRVKYLNEYDKKFRKESEKVSGFVGEIVRGIRDIKLLHAEESFTNELHEDVKNLNSMRYQMNSVNRNYRLLRENSHDLFDLGMIFLLVYLIVEGNLAIANALVIYNYVGRVASIIDWIGILVEKVKDFNLSSSRIFAIMKDDEFRKEKFGTKHLERVHGDFSFSHVIFHYDTDDKKVLDDLSFEVHANETVAFVGKSGAGKSTIFSLLCKMYDVDSGCIQIDGVDISQLDQDSIRGNITVISQSPYIFHLSIRDNLRLMAPSVTEEEMIRACKMACIHDFITSLPDGYDTIIGEGGINLSGGQRQRLAIARAFLQKTEIILFDEATSALDNETQKEIQKAIHNLQKDYTILIIAHRLSTIIDCDRILFIENGKIVAEGTHQKLLKTCKGYKELYEAELRNQK